MGMNIGDYEALERKFQTLPGTHWLKTYHHEPLYDNDVDTNASELLPGAENGFSY